MKLNRQIIDFNYDEWLVRFFLSGGVALNGKKRMENEAIAHTLGVNRGISKSHLRYEGEHLVISRTGLEYINIIRGD